MMAQFHHLHRKDHLNNFQPQQVSGIQGFQYIAKASQNKL